MSNMNLQLQSRIQKVQNSCVRFIFSIRKRDCHRIINYLNKLAWLSMEKRRLLHMLSEVYKIYNNLSANYLKFNTTSDIHNYSTRQADHIYIPMRRTAISTNSFMSRGPVLYNNLPDNIKQMSSLMKFKQACKKYLLLLQMPSDNDL